MKKIIFTLVVISFSAQSMPCQDEWDNIIFYNKWAYRCGNASTSLCAINTAAPNMYTFFGACFSGLGAYSCEHMRNTTIKTYKTCMTKHAEAIHQEIQNAGSRPHYQEEIDKLNEDFKQEPIQ